MPKKYIPTLQLLEINEDHDCTEQLISAAVCCLRPPDTTEVSGMFVRHSIFLSPSANPPKRPESTVCYSISRFFPRPLYRVSWFSASRSIVSGCDSPAPPERTDGRLRCLSKERELSGARTSSKAQQSPYKTTCKHVSYRFSFGSRNQARLFFSINLRLLFAGKLVKMSTKRSHLAKSK